MSDIASGYSHLGNKSLYSWSVKVSVVGFVSRPQGSSVEHIQWFCVASLLSLEAVLDTPYHRQPITVVQPAEVACNPYKRFKFS